ncbi:electron carrier [Spatholobus suberectus]|nr:electron carrier [Spatholobus suberectus]
MRGRMRNKFVRKLKLVPTIINLKQGLVLHRKFPTPYDDYKENNLSELVVEDDNHFEEEEATVGSKETELAEEKLLVAMATNKMASCNNEYPSLTDFKELCPPGGNHSIILYTTSLRGIRKTFQDCNTIRFLLRSFKIMYHERDVSLHLEFREELWKILGGKVIPPKLFIKGRYIGGADEVVGLHEMGWLGKFLEGTPTHSSDSPCTGCANMRFAICSNCCGSCKVFAGNRDNNDEFFVRCSECNENGLVKCPVCC